MKHLKRILTPVCLLCIACQAQAQKANDVTAPLHAMQPDYPVPYNPPTTEAVKKVLDRIYNYLDAGTPAQLINRSSGEALTNISAADTNTIFKPGDFRLTSYEWGVTYSGMLQVATATGDKKYTEYTTRRMQLIADAIPVFKPMWEKYHNRSNPLRSVMEPHALDDAGAICAAMIRTVRSGAVNNLRPVIDNYIQYISTKEFRFPDGTLARNRPHPNTIWLDDLYMSVPALSQMGKLTGDKKYFDDAVKQVLQFSERMFNKEKNLFMHGWVQGMKEHPQFHWARANGWAIMTMVDLLDVLPENHPGYPKVLELLKTHVRGIAACQSGTGFWHQLLDRNDSYLETSATAIYTYCIAHAIQKGWIDPVAYAPMAMLAWNAIVTKVNDKGQVEGTCVGTGMGFDPAFYYYRPVNVYAAHGYGPVLLAGAAIYELLQKNKYRINDSALQYYEEGAK
jgi:unsaturated rhamnogalacturonyl hydrolase